MKKHIPNTLTAANLLVGCMGITWVLAGDPSIGLYFILLAAVFDFLDGFAARLLGVSSPIGKELDSLADMVTFGVLPSMIVYRLFEQMQAHIFFLYLAFLIAILSAVRLARFNLDTRQSDRFIGLPTPANALFIAGLPYLSTYLKESYGGFSLLSIWSLSAVVIVFSLLLIADLPLPALKFKGLAYKENHRKYLIIFTSIVLVSFFKAAGISVAILFYLLMALFEPKSSK